MKDVVIRGLLALSLPFALVGAATAENVAERSKADSGAMCARTMQDSTPEGRMAMEDFMKSDRAPETMANMMEMARRMGNGDAMLGMTRMMEMLGSMGGRMSGGQGGMMQPGGQGK